MSGTETRVLLVDDNADDYELLRAYLKRIAGRTYKLHWAASYDEGWAWLRETDYDVCLIDYRLGGRDGIELIQQATRQGCRTPLILLTAYEAPDIDLYAMQCGASDYLSKQEVTPSLLDRSIRYAIERRRVRQQQRSTEAKLRQRQTLEAIGELVGGIAHEFNNLLQAIQGYGEFAIEGLSPSDQRHQDLEQLLEAASRAAALTRQLLSASRQQPLERRRVDPNRLVEESVQMLRPIVGEHIDISVDLGLRTEKIYADPAMLQQVMMNLFINARDAMPRGGRLSVRTESAWIDDDGPLSVEVRPGRYLRLTVADTGGGMPRQVQGRVFDPFFTTKEVGKGTGLGLSIVHGIVQQHEGAICVDSKRGEGTTFEIYLPLAVSTPADAHEGQREGAELILVAEDEPLVRNVAVRILKNAGYGTIEADNGADAVRLFEANAEDISLVMLDVMMPRMSGHDAYRRMKRINPQVKAIFCTGYDTHSGPVDFVAQTDEVVLIQKPFDPESLLRMVRAVLCSETDEAAGWADTCSCSAAV